MINKQEQEFFNRLAPQWETLCYGKEELLSSLDDLLGMLPFKKGMDVLDLGCGTGLSSRNLLKYLGNKGKVYSCDFSLEMLKENEKHQKSNISNICCDVHYLPFMEKTFDYVLIFSCFPHFDDKAKVFAEANRVLKNGGIVSVAHLMSREELNSMHNDIEDVVKEDRLPDAEKMIDYAQNGGFEIIELIDKTGLYIFTVRKEEDI